MKFPKLIAFDLGYGLGICPAEAGDTLIPNVAAVNSAIVRFRIPESTGDQWDQDFKEQKAYATLFAASPELLEAAKQALRVIQGEIEGLEGKKVPTYLTLSEQSLSEAIKKAEGGK